MEKALDELETAPDRSKREANNYYLSDEVAKDPKDPQQAEAEAEFEVRSSVKDVQVPMKDGSPAFSIHAEKVYILYPSLFQDPNIFGRFSIPQNINLDPLPEKNVKSTEAPGDSTPALMQPQYMYPDPYQSAFTGRKMAKRQAADPNSPPVSTPKLSTRKDDYKKRNVESHLTGTIVVLNQDVNELNRKESY